MDIAQFIYSPADKYVCFFPTANKATMNIV